MTRRRYTRGMRNLRAVEGNLDAAGLRFAIVASRFNGSVVRRLLDGAVAELRSRGAEPAQVDIVRVPGAFDLPVAVRRVVETWRPDAVIALGAVIRGETPHFDYVARACASGLTRIAVDTGIPIAFGVLTADTDRQARARSGGSAGNRGSDAAQAAIRLATLMRKLVPRS